MGINVFEYSCQRVGSSCDNFISQTQIENLIVGTVILVVC